MIAFGASGATPKQRMAQIAAGLGLLPSVIIDQHFQQRNRLGRLLSLIAQNPSLLGLGVDEDTAGVVGPGPRPGRHRPRQHHDRRRRSLRDRRLGGPRPPAADDQQRRAAFAAGRLPVRPPPAASDRRPGAARGGGRRGGVELTGRQRALGRRARRSEPARGPAQRRRAKPRQRPRHAGGDRPEPTLRILETRILRGPNYWAREPVIRMLVDLGIARGVPLQHDPRVRRRARRSSCRRSRTTPARSAGAAAS